MTKKVKTHKESKECKKRKVPEPIYLVDDGETFHGTLAQLKECFFDNATELNMVDTPAGFIPGSELVDWAKQNNMKLQRQTRRGKDFVLRTLYDPAKPDKMTYQRIKWGRNQGKCARSLTYTDSDGREYTFRLQFDRDTCRIGFNVNGKMTHKHEIEYRILDRLVKAVNGMEEPE